MATAMTKAKVHVEFEMWTTYHPPVGFQKRGHNEFYWRSKCGRWHVRQGAKGEMIVTDCHKDVLHVVAGKMLEVEAFVNAASEVAAKQPEADDGCWNM